MMFLLFSLGWYWIDPNLGMPDDAIFVFCNMTNGHTCITPDTHTGQMPAVAWQKEGNKTNWFSNLHDGSKVISVH